VVDPADSRHIETNVGEYRTKSDTNPNSKVQDLFSSVDTVVQKKTIINQHHKHSILVPSDMQMGTKNKKRKIPGPFGWRRRVKDEEKEVGIVMQDDTVPIEATDELSQSSSSTSTASKEQIKGCLKVKTQSESINGACTTSSSDEAKPKIVKFSSLEIYEHTMMLGDNPGGTNGPPLTIAWERDDSRSFQVDDYESRRPTRRKHYQMHVPRRLREDWLMKAGYSRGEMREAEEIATKIQKSRYANSKDSPLQLGGLKRLFKKSGPDDCHAKKTPSVESF
jgi:hypothetical protein